MSTTTTTTVTPTSSSTDDTDAAPPRAGTATTDPAVEASSLDPAQTGLLVIKVGGGDTLDLEAVWDDLAALHEQGIQFILVHGGNAALTRLQAEVGRPAHFVSDGKGRESRYTDAEAMRLFTMVYAGEQNKNHVVGLLNRGVPAVGLSGVDGAMMRARRRSTIRVVEDGKKKVLRDDHIGTLHRLDPTLLRITLENGFVPVVTVPAYADGPEGQGGVMVNVDGDTAASTIAREVGAGGVVFLSDVPGLLRDPKDPNSLIRQVTTDVAWDEAVAAGKGRMRRKVEGARRAVDAGIGQVVFAQASGNAPIRRALQGHGTVFRAPPAPDATTETTLDVDDTPSA